MHTNHFTLPFLLPLLLGCGLAWGQVLAPKPEVSPVSAAAVNGTPSDAAERTVHIQVEDSAVRIDEIRMGGDTQSISVQPKGGMPAYQVAPKTGERTWKVLGF
jgi:hypothetical protein